MKKIYKAKYSVLVDGMPVAVNYFVQWKLQETPPSNELLPATEERCDSSPYIEIVFYGFSRWKKRPYIIVPGRGGSGYKYYLDCHNVQLRTEWIEVEDVTISEILENMTAEDAIEYLKDRGLAVCPVKKE